MTESEWTYLKSDVLTQMVEYVKYYISPISLVNRDDATNNEFGVHLGTGSFVEIDGIKYLVTNAHVARYIEQNKLVFQFWENNNVYQITQNPDCILASIDFARIQIPDETWTHSSHRSKTIYSNQFMPKHEVINEELYFICGYSGERSKFLYSTMNSVATPYLVQQKKEVPASIETEISFALFYEPEKASGNARGLPNPHGFSGSLVWNTNFVKALQAGEKWKPTDARVTGIITKWLKNSKVLIATKVECFFPFLKFFGLTI